MFSCVLREAGSNSILFKSSRETIQVWHGILQRADLYVAVTLSALSISARKNEIHAANIITRPLIPKCSASGFSNNGRSIISKHF